jgi:anti-anti-sigma regulatory factor
VRTAARTDGVHAVVLDAESVPTIDVTAARMLAELADELQRMDVGFVLARDVGQVRDVIRRADEGAVPTTSRSLGDALDMVSER